MASHTPSLSIPAPRSSGHDNATERETAEGKYHLVYKHEKEDRTSPRPTSADLGLASTLPPEYNSEEQASAGQFAAEKGAAMVQKFPDGTNHKFPTGVAAARHFPVEEDAATLGSTGETRVRYNCPDGVLNLPDDEMAKIAQAEQEKDSTLLLGQCSASRADTNTSSIKSATTLPGGGLHGPAGSGTTCAADSPNYEIIEKIEAFRKKGDSTFPASPSAPAYDKSGRSAASGGAAPEVAGPRPDFALANCATERVDLQKIEPDEKIGACRKGEATDSPADPSYLRHEQMSSIASSGAVALGTLLPGPVGPMARTDVGRAKTAADNPAAGELISLRLQMASATQVLVEINLPNSSDFAPEDAQPSGSPLLEPEADLPKAAAATPLGRVAKLVENIKSSIKAKMSSAKMRNSQLYSDDQPFVRLPPEPSDAPPPPKERPSLAKCKVKHPPVHAPQPRTKAADPSLEINSDFGDGLEMDARRTARRAMEALGAFRAAEGHALCRKVDPLFAKSNTVIVVIQVEDEPHKGETYRHVQLASFAPAGSTKLGIASDAAILALPASDRSSGNLGLGALIKAQLDKKFTRSQAGSAWQLYHVCNQLANLATEPIMASHCIEPSDRTYSTKFQSSAGSAVQMVHVITLKHGQYAEKAMSKIAYSECQEALSEAPPIDKAVQHVWLSARLALLHRLEICNRLPPESRNQTSDHSIVKKLLKESTHAVQHAVREMANKIIIVPHQKGDTDGGMISACTNESVKTIIRTLRTHLEEGNQLSESEKAMALHFFKQDPRFYQELGEGVADDRLTIEVVASNANTKSKCLAVVLRADESYEGAFVQPDQGGRRILKQYDISGSTNAFANALRGQSERNDRERLKAAIMGRTKEAHRGRLLLSTEPCCQGRCGSGLRSNIRIQSSSLKEARREVQDTGRQTSHVRLDGGGPPFLHFEFADASGYDNYALPFNFAGGQAYSKYEDNGEMDHVLPVHSICELLIEEFTLSGCIDALDKRGSFRFRIGAHQPIVNRLDGILATPGSLQWLCSKCHSAKTAEDNRALSKKQAEAMAIEVSPPSTDLQDWFLMASLATTSNDATGASAVFDVPAAPEDTSQRLTWVYRRLEAVQNFLPPLPELLSPTTVAMVASIAVAYLAPSPLSPPPDCPPSPPVSEDEDDQPEQKVAPKKTPIDLRKAMDNRAKKGWSIQGQLAIMKLRLRRPRPVANQEALTASADSAGGAQGKPQVEKSAAPPAPSPPASPPASHDQMEEVTVEVEPPAPVPVPVPATTPHLVVPESAGPGEMARAERGQQGIGVQVYNNVDLSAAPGAHAPSQRAQVEQPLTWNTYCAPDLAAAIDEENKLQLMSFLEQFPNVATLGLSPDEAELTGQPDDGCDRRGNVGEFECLDTEGNNAFKPDGLQMAGAFHAATHSIVVHYDEGQKFRDDLTGSGVSKSHLRGHLHESSGAVFPAVVPVVYLRQDCNWGGNPNHDRNQHGGTPRRMDEPGPPQASLAPNLAFARHCAIHGYAVLRVPTSFAPHIILGRTDQFHTILAPYLTGEIHHLIEKYPLLNFTTATAGTRHSVQGLIDALRIHDASRVFSPNGQPFQGDRMDTTIYQSLYDPETGQLATGDAMRHVVERNVELHMGPCVASYCNTLNDDFDPPMSYYDDVAPTDYYDGMAPLLAKYLDVCRERPAFDEVMRVLVEAHRRVERDSSMRRAPMHVPNLIVLAMEVREQYMVHPDLAEQEIDEAMKETTGCETVADYDQECLPSNVEDETLSVEQAGVGEAAIKQRQLHWCTIDYAGRAHLVGIRAAATPADRYHFQCKSLQRELLSDATELHTTREAHVFFHTDDHCYVRKTTNGAVGVHGIQAMCELIQDDLTSDGAPGLQSYLQAAERVIEAEHPQLLQAFREKLWPEGHQQPTASQLDRHHTPFSVTEQASAELVGDRPTGVVKRTMIAKFHVHLSPGDADQLEVGLMPLPPDDAGSYGWMPLTDVYHIDDTVDLKLEKGVSLGSRLFAATYPSRRVRNPTFVHGRCPMDQYPKPPATEQNAFATQLNMLNWCDVWGQHRLHNREHGVHPRSQPRGWKPNYDLEVLRAMSHQKLPLGSPPPTAPPSPAASSSGDSSGSGVEYEDFDQGGNDYDCPWVLASVQRGDYGYDPWSADGTDLQHLLHRRQCDQFNPSTGQPEPSPFIITDGREEEWYRRPCPYQPANASPEQEDGYRNSHVQLGAGQDGHRPAPPTQHGTFLFSSGPPPCFPRNQEGTYTRCRIRQPGGPVRLVGDTRSLGSVVRSPSAVGGVRGRVTTVMAIASRNVGIHNSELPATMAWAHNSLLAMIVLPNMNHDRSKEGRPGNSPFWTSRPTDVPSCELAIQNLLQMVDGRIGQISRCGTYGTHYELSLIHI